VSVLAGWWRELRDAGNSETATVNVIAERLGESPAEARRLLSDLGRVKLGGPRSRGAAAPAAVSRLDVRAVRESYRAYREAGSREDQAVKAVAREFGERPHDVRRVVGVVEFELGRE
jgi:hypothetical protein